MMVAVAANIKADMKPNALILFVRKPERGKVKTRIAATAGEDAALFIYEKLLQHTYNITTTLDCTRYVFYADAIEDEDMWTGYEKLFQAETDLGNRMKEAFAQLFQKGHHHICIIGSDCYELSTGMIENAFTHLQEHDIVIGPAHDGGYYLLAMKEELKDVFQKIDWSTEKVLYQTIEQLKQNHWSYFLLPVLHDVDTIDDVPPQWKEEFKILH